MTTVLDESSLAETLWRLEEARISGELAGSQDVRSALDWIVGRIGAQASYRDIMAAPTGLDLTDFRTNPTAERFGRSRAGVKHILGEEAIRALSLWGRGQACEEAVQATLAWGVNGRFCCGACSVARWGALAAAQPNGWEADVAAGLRGLLAQSLDGGRWRGRPFYYTLLTLSGIPLEEAVLLACSVRPAVERALARLSDGDRAARFRRRALEWAATAA